MTLDLIDLLQAHGIEFRRYGEHHHATRGRISVDCPKCSPRSHKFRLGIHLTTGVCHCWNCGRVDRVEVISLLCRIGISKVLEFWKGVTPRDTYERLVTSGRLEVPPGVGGLLPAHKRYLKKRGFDPDEICKIWEVKGIGPSVPGMQWRLFIPIFDYMGQMVTWTTRSISKDEGMKYRAASPDQEIVSHKSVLYGAHLARHAIVVVEGPTSAWAIGPGAVATCGLSFTKEQESEIGEYPIRVICFDSEDKAQRKAERLCQNLSCFPGVTEMVTLETGNDPASSDPDEIRDLRSRYLE